MASHTRADAWFKHMTLLRRHMLTCGKCKGALKASYPDHLCLTGSLLVAQAALEFNAILDIKRKAHKHPDGFVYACPDVSLHGQAYALAAQPLAVTGIQEGLF